MEQAVVGSATDNAVWKSRKMVKVIFVLIQTRSFSLSFPILPCSIFLSHSSLFTILRWFTQTSDFQHNFFLDMKMNFIIRFISCAYFLLFCLSSLWLALHVILRWLLCRLVRGCWSYQRILVLEENYLSFISSCSFSFHRVRNWRRSFSFSAIDLLSFISSHLEITMIWADWNSYDFI